MATSANTRTSVLIPRIGSKSRQIERFQSLVDELSAAMARVSVDEIDKEIKEWLGKIVLALEVDRGAFWERAASDGGFVGTHWWARPGIPRLPNKLRSMQISPWATAQILAGKTVVYSNPEDLPKEAAKLRQFLKSSGPWAGVMLPLQIGDLVLGALTFGKFRAPRYWSPNEVQRLRIVGRVVAGALDRKRAERRLEQVREELKLAVQHTVIGQLAASIAHEVNQPLGAILSNAQAARRFLATKRPNLKDLGAAIEDIIQDNSRAVETIRNIRALFQRDEAQMSPIDLRQILNDVERILAAEAMRKNVTLRLNLPAALPTVVGNRIQLVQALMNLVLNAFDAVCEDGNGSREVEIRASQSESGRLHISVRDSGKGIDSEVIPRLFDAFFTTKPKGMGMGLAIVRSIVETHGGRVWATRNLERGATLEFELPVEVSAESKN